MLRGLPRLNLPEIEEKILAFWKDSAIFQKSLQRRQGQHPFVFYEGPPTANGRPGAHHVLARVFKDVILRYKTMRGYLVPRRAGWDTQGLPVEIEVEKELGIRQKQDIEKFGIAAFNQRARASVWRYKDEWEKLTERIGFWLDFDNAYVTYDNRYLEKLWGVLQQIDKRQLLYQGHKVVPWCPRCGTALSSHELAQGYREVEDTSVYVKFKVKARDPEWQNVAILSWTTTPWTLPGNVALAVNPRHKFVSVVDPSTGPGEIPHWLVLEKTSAVRLGFKIEDEFSAKELVGIEYEPLFKIKALQSPKSYQVYAAGFVTAAEGTGVVHTAVMYGEDDYELGKKVGLPQHHIVDSQGRFTKDVPEFVGLAVKDKITEEKIIAHLEAEGSKLKTETYAHEYPFCWRCDAPVLYYATNSWFIQMSKLRNQLLAENEKINWIPERLREGRFGQWLKEVKDWAISRERYWGTPLPVWQCTEKCGGKVVVGSLWGLNRHAYGGNRYWAVRHGESDHNLGRWLSSDQKTDKRSALTDRGQDQAALVARTLKKHSIDVIYCSPFLRAKQTAEIIRKTVRAPIIIDKRLAEVNSGMFNGKPVEDYESFFEAPSEKFTKAPFNGETLQDVRQRVMSFIVDISRQHQGKNIVIISHGDSLWMLETGLQALDDAAALAWAQEHYWALGDCRQLTFNNWPFDGAGRLDLHRPFIDQIVLQCPRCRKSMQRVSEVIDVWFDSGAMPFAAGEHPDRYPADYICEAIDQTRGWFYTLLAVGVLLEAGMPYRNVISLGHLLDKDGQKMSKSRGNVVEPWDIINRYGADAVRWYFFTVNPPGEPKKFDEANIGEAQRRFIILLYNAYSFFATYAGESQKFGAHFQSRHPLDQWILARLHQTTDIATRNLDTYDVGGAGKVIELLVDDLSHWYIRRSRKRPEALPVLGFVLGEISKLIAPFTPFFAEALYGELGIKNYELRESVHLEDWPMVTEALIDKELLDRMTEIRHLASLALAKRAAAGIKVRQPLQKFKIQTSKLKISEELLKVLADEINVKEIIFDSKIKEEVELDIQITPALKSEGLVRELVRTVQGLRKEKKLQPQDKIILEAQLPDEWRAAVEGNKDFAEETGIAKIEYKKGETVKLAIKKV